MTARERPAPNPWARPRLTWRQYQRLRTWAIHARDVLACLLAIGLVCLVAALVA